MECTLPGSFSLPHSDAYSRSIGVSGRFMVGTASGAHPTWLIVIRWNPNSTKQEGGHMEAKK